MQTAKVWIVHLSLPKYFDTKKSNNMIDRIRDEFLPRKTIATWLVAATIQDQVAKNRINPCHRPKPPAALRSWSIFVDSI